MSGGAYDYAYSKIDSIIYEIKEEIKETIETYKEYPENIEKIKIGKPRRKLLLEILSDVSKMLYIAEWIDSGDCGSEDWKKFDKKIKKLKNRLSKYKP